MVDLNAVPNVPLKVVFLLHFILCSWGLGHWSPPAYLFYNLVFFLVLSWAIYQRDSEEVLIMAVAVAAASIFLDVIVLSMYFPNGLSAASERFSGGMAILNLLLRPVTALVLYRVYTERAGSVGTSLPGFFGGSGAQRSPYEDIDSVHHQSVPRTDASSPTPFGSTGASGKMPPPYHG